MLPRALANNMDLPAAVKEAFFKEAVGLKRGQRDS
jgi:hypothetical protein